MFRRKRSVDPGMTVHAEMPEIETDNPSRMSRRQRRAAEKAEKREAMEAAKRQAARKKAAAKHKLEAKKKGSKKKPQPREQNKRAISAQATIPYREMGKDGICRVHDRLYSKTIRYLDLNYQLAQPDDKADIFDGWSEFLNYFDYTIHAQLTFSNRHSIAAELENLIKVRPRKDRFADLMEEYADMLREQLQKGNNGLILHLFQGEQRGGIRRLHQRLPGTGAVRHGRDGAVRRQTADTLHLRILAQERTHGRGGKEDYMKE